ncbi:hypothetical protein Bca52824_020277 [Brassica carinata]|uniref:Protein kinase domain-containing protein n=1 Tax=Brassica carinata TaxID=52824 RepID=A0A8X8AZF8_BRACI|nr:hypothetical protein Bca52824_020277 [Brassica carinata]
MAQHCSMRRSDSKLMHKKKECHRWSLFQAVGNSSDPCSQNKANWETLSEASVAKLTKSKRQEWRNKAVAESDRATEGGTSDRRNKRFSWEKRSDEEGSVVGTLVFLGRGELDTTLVRYSMDDLLKASAETLGRGTLGSTYKAVMESGFIVTVKRLKDAGGFTRMEEFKRQIEILGRLKHTNLNPSLTHGNLKSSNVLLGPDFESCLTDYGLRDLHEPPNSVEDTNASSLFYKAPECRDSGKATSQPSDVYSFGVLLLELLTGKTSFHEHGSDISRWVRAVREAETESGEEMNSCEEKLQALLSIATTCVAVQPEKRPVMREVVKMVKDARAEAAVLSSYSSDHSPGRWSESVQSLPREDHMSI